jgi:hypothetical protein
MPQFYMYNWLYSDLLFCPPVQVVRNCFRLPIYCGMSEDFSLILKKMHNRALEDIGVLLFKFEALIN